MLSHTAHTAMKVQLQAPFSCSVIKSICLAGLYMHWSEIIVICPPGSKPVVSSHIQCNTVAVINPSIVANAQLQHVMWFQQPRCR